MASPFFGPPPLSVVGSSPPHPAVSPEIGSTTNTAEMIDGSAAAAGFNVGAMGGAPAAPGRAQLTCEDRRWEWDRRAAALRSTRITCQPWLRRYRSASA